MDNVTNFPPLSDGSENLLIGPFQEWRVKVDGRIIPRLTGFHDGDDIALVLDNRFSVTVPKKYAVGVAWMIANALAIGQGYSNVGAENKDQPFAPIGCAIESTDEKPGAS